MRNPEIGEAWSRSAEIVAALEKWMVEKGQRKAFLNYRKSDKLRLLRFRTWQFRYRVQLTEMFDILIPILRMKMERKRRGYGIGVSITALVGEGAEEILKEEIEKRYPEGSNLTLWKESERARQLKREELEEAGMMTRKSQISLSILQAQSVDEYVSRYRCEITGKKQRATDESTRKSRRLRAYRNNPWV